MKTPVLFISHGSPLAAIAPDRHTAAWAAFGKSLQPVKAVLIVSAHWRAASAEVGAAVKPSTIYDFGGFPPALFEVRYQAPGEPALAARICRLLGEAGIDSALNHDRGLDHGVWVPLLHLFPDAALPVVPLALPKKAQPADLFAVGKALAGLRREGILIVGSGGMTHNLDNFIAGAGGEPAAWATEFDDWATRRVVLREFADLIAFREKAPFAKMAHPTWEHFAPLFVVTGASDADDSYQSITEGIEFGTLSLRSFALK